MSSHELRIRVWSIFMTLSIRGSALVFEGTRLTIGTIRHSTETFIHVIGIQFDPLDRFNIVWVERPNYDRPGTLGTMEKVEN